MWTNEFQHRRTSVHSLYYLLTKIVLLKIVLDLFERLRISVRERIKTVIGSEKLCGNGKRRHKTVKGLIQNKYLNL